MEHSAPVCTWKSFREWALIAMSCQQSFSFVEKQSFAHTHLVNAIYGCCKLVQELQGSMDAEIRTGLEELSYGHDLEGLRIFRAQVTLQRLLM